MKNLFWAGLILASALSAHADVHIESVIRSGGFKGTGAYEGKMKRQLQSNKGREESDVKYTGKMMRLMAGGLGNKIEIVRIDQDKIWTLNPAKKTYTERPITVKLEETPSSSDSKNDAPSGPAAPEEKPTHRLKKTDVSVAKTGEKKVVNGFSTEEVKATVVVEVEEIATKEVTTFHSDTRVWQTPLTKELKTALEEEKKYGQAFLAKVRGGMTASDQAALGGGQLALMLGLGTQKSSEIMKSMQVKLAQFNGYPVVTDSKWFLIEDPKAIARREAAEQKEDEADAPNLSTDPKDLAGGLLGGFAKKKMKERQQKANKAKEGAPVFATYVEVKSIDTRSISSDTFEIPTGYKKVK
jgi:hypothetical protein